MPGLRETPLYAAYHQTMADGASRTVEYFHPPGKRWFDIRLYPSPEGLSIFVRDVTESRTLTQELRASEARYRTLVDQLPAVVYSTSAADERITYFSPYLYEMTGYRPDEVLAEASDWHWLEFIHPEDRDRVAGEDEADVPIDQPIRLEYRIARKDGGTLWVRDESLPIHDETGAIVAWQGILMDITDRIEAEEARARLAALVDSADDAIISRTLDGVITSWNHGAEQMYGYRAEEVIGKPLAFLLPEEDPGSALVPAERLSDQPMHFEGTRWRRDGSAFAASIALSPIRDRNGMLIGISSITRDISAQKRADEELRAALEAAQAGIRAKSLFLAMMSHELRTPLQAVLGYADFLLNGPPGSLSPEQREDVSYIHQGAGRMVTLIEQMLDLSRMEAGRLEIASEPVELAKLVEQVRQDVGPQVTAKSLEFAIDVSPTLPPVLGDPVRLRQILLNLVGNAVKFTEAGSVRIGAAATEQSVTVTVRDTGIGIAPEALPFIFEEFRQVDGNMTRRYGGAGLGLAIAKRLAEQMGGSISVESAPGAGSTFTLRLPAARPTRRRRRLTRDA
jgi:PAS domain S-box-containing protein